MAYSEKFKENLLARTLAPNSNISGLARQSGVPKQSLFAWVRQAKLSSVSSRSKKKRGRPRNSRLCPKWREGHSGRFLGQRSILLSGRGMARKRSPRHQLTDAQWTLLAPMFEVDYCDTGRRPRDRREIVNAIFWVLGTGAPWRDLPA
ncbi:MAG: transposase [Myxococcales bacterium]|nr:transposase [Myxococcales bacterium]